MARDFVGGFQVGLQNRLFDVAAAFVSAGVYVDGDERLGFVDHDVAAAFQPDLAMKGVVDLFLHAEGLEDRRGAVVKLDAVARAPRNLADHLVHPLDRRLIVADHFVDFVGEEIAHRALDQIRLFEDAAGRGLVLDRLLDLRPLLDEEAQIAHEITGALAFADGADDDAHAFRDLQAAQDLAQPFAFLRVLDLARDAAAIAVRHEHQIAPGEAEIGRDARALGADRALSSPARSLPSRPDKCSECPWP